MLSVMILLVVCSALAWLYKDIAFYYGKSLGRLVFYLLAIILVCFGGLRTTMNDTWQYLQNFLYRVPSTLDELYGMNLLIGANPLFMIYQFALKMFVSESEHVFIFITTAFTTMSYILFFRKYSLDFRFTIFVYLALTTYGFTLAAMKQSIATAIALWSFPMAVDGKKFRALLVIFIAVLFHPYVIVFISEFFFIRTIWDKFSLILMLPVMIAAVAFRDVMEIATRFTAIIGDKYSGFGDASDYGIKIYRTLVYLVVPASSFVYRKNLRKTGNKFMLAAINMCIVSGAIAIIASFGGAIEIGRLISYFDAFTCLSLPFILRYGIKNRALRSSIMFISVPLFCIYYYTYYSKYLPIDGSWLTDFYRHISIWELITQ